MGGSGGTDGFGNRSDGLNGCLARNGRNVAPQAMQDNRLSLGHKPLQIKGPAAPPRGYEQWRAARSASIARLTTTSSPPRNSPPGRHIRQRTRCLRTVRPTMERAGRCRVRGCWTCRGSSSGRPMKSCRSGAGAVRSVPCRLSNQRSQGGDGAAVGSFRLDHQGRAAGSVADLSGHDRWTSHPVRNVASRDTTPCCLSGYVMHYTCGAVCKVPKNRWEQEAMEARQGLQSRPVWC